MSFNSFEQFLSDEQFYAVIDRLKRQDALPEDSFIQNIPFFTLDSISKESQVKELFEESCDPQLYKRLLRNIVPLPEDAEEDFSNKLTTSNMMTFAQLCLYKVLPCPDPNCVNRPREIVTHNQYKDHEYECPFYHHDKDRRRMAIPSSVDEEFTYKANYYEGGRSQGEKDKYSLNYFESMFHPLYYKMFKCKREHCNACHSCPFFHFEEEKKTWDNAFSNFIRKDRITYVKDKQKYYESTSHSSQGRSSGDQSPKTPYSPNNRQQNQRRQQRNNQHQKSPQTPTLSYSPTLQTQNGRRVERSRQNKRWEGANKTPYASRQEPTIFAQRPESFGPFDHTVSC